MLGFISLRLDILSDLGILGSDSVEELLQVEFRLDKLLADSFNCALSDLKHLQNLRVIHRRAALVYSDAVILPALTDVFPSVPSFDGSQCALIAHYKLLFILTVSCPALVRKTLCDLRYSLYRKTSGNLPSQPYKTPFWGHIPGLVIPTRMESL
jgi:hypothetical protein